MAISTDALWVLPIWKFDTLIICHLSENGSNRSPLKTTSLSRTMASVLRFLRKTLKRGTNVVRRVGKVARSTAKRGTNAIGLTKRAHRKSHRKSGRKSHSHRK